jgi:hypothetical protein
MQGFAHIDPIGQVIESIKIDESGARPATRPLCADLNNDLPEVPA